MDTPAPKAAHERIPTPDQIAKASVQRAHVDPTLLSETSRLSAALDAGRVMCWEWDIAENHCYFTTDHVAFFGLPPTTDPVELANPNVGVVDEDAEKVMEAARIALLGGPELMIEFRGKVPDNHGQTRWYAANARTIRRPDGTPIRMVGITREISQRKRLELALAERESLLRSVANNIPDAALFQIIAQGGAAPRLSYASGNLSHLMDRNIPLGEVGVTALLKTIPEPTRGQFRRALASPDESGEPLDFEVSVVPDVGHRRVVRLRAAARAIGPGVAAFDGIASDVTALRNEEERRRTFERGLWEMQRLESLGLLAGGIAHDFNNLLTGILGNASLLERVIPPDSPHQDAIDQILRASLSAADLCRQMLSYAGRKEIRIRRCILSNLIRDTVDLVRASIPRSSNVVLQLDEDIPPIRADVVQLQQVLMNLIINAAEALPAGKGTIQVRTSVNSAPDGSGVPFVKLCVEDDGCGIPADAIPHLFEPFYSTKFAGRGLGLSAAQGIVSLHGGRIDVESTVGRGSCFCVQIPLVLSDDESDRASADNEAEGLLDGKGTILVVDDEEWPLRVVEKIARSLGYQVALAHDGREALALLEALPDVVLMVLDITMPVMDGIEVLKRLSMQHRFLPVVLMSGHAGPGLEKRLEGLSSPVFLPKPFTRATFIEAAARALILARDRGKRGSSESIPPLTP